MAFKYFYFLFVTYSEEWYSLNLQMDTPTLGDIYLQFGIIKKGHFFKKSIVHKNLCIVFEYPYTSSAL